MGRAFRSVRFAFAKPAYWIEGSSGLLKKMIIIWEEYLRVIKIDLLAT